MKRLKVRSIREAEDSNITDDQCEGYTGGYAYDDENCPCGKYKPGRCKTGIVIPLWTTDEIDEFIEKWAENVAYNPAYKNFPSDKIIEDGEYKNM